jgi:uridine phosphorylase
MAKTKIIGSSELVLNKDGSIYHLHLLPEDIADIVFLVGDPARVKKVSNYFDRIELKKQKREFVTHTGYIGKKRLSVLSTGIGTDNIDIVMNELDALVNINLKARLPNKKTKSLQLIRLGTSGALQKDIPIDSMVVSTHGLGFDGLLNYYLLKYKKKKKLYFIRLINTLTMSTCSQKLTLQKQIRNCFRN